MLEMEKKMKVKMKELLSLFVAVLKDNCLSGFFTMRASWVSLCCYPDSADIITWALKLELEVEVGDIWSRKTPRRFFLWRWMGLVRWSAGGLEESKIASNGAGRDLRSTATENFILPVSEWTWNQVLPQSLHMGAQSRQDLKRETPIIKNPIKPTQISDYRTVR